MPTDKDSKKEYFQGYENYTFPNGRYISKFYAVSSREAGLTKLDVDLYNRCFLPWNPLSYFDTIDERKHKKRWEDDVYIPTNGHEGDNSPRPTYQINEPPCKRQGAIGANCRFINTNGTFSGLLKYEDAGRDFDVQQQCYCVKYPYFDSSFGCNECFRQHGGIEGYHWFPESYMSAISSAYCNADPVTTAFMPFYMQWKSTDPVATGVVSSPTAAPDLLGTQTAASLYYTYEAASTGGKSGGSRGNGGTNRFGLLASVAVALSIGVLCGF